MKKVEKIINEINGSMAIEGMHLTNADKKRMRECYGDKESYNRMVKSLVHKHTVKQGAGYEQ